MLAGVEEAISPREDPDEKLTPRQRLLQKKTSRAILQERTPRSLCCFTSKNPIRRAMVAIAESHYFKGGVLAVIMVNCVFLALDDNPPSDSVKFNVLMIAEYIFLTLFSLEIIVKVIAEGFLFAGARSYLRDLWNILDIIVVLSAAIQMMLGPGYGSGLSALRSFRILRPLRAIKSVKAMKALVSALLSSLPMLLDVFLLFTFLIFVFGILGVQLFMGDLRFRCHDPMGVVTDQVCNTDVQCGKGSFCADVGESMNSNMNGFDNILMAWITILQCITMEGWSDVMYALSDTGVPAIAYLYCHFLIFVGSMFVINLFTAVIFLRFQQSKEEEKENMMEILREKNREFLEKSKDAANDMHDPGTVASMFGSIHTSKSAKVAPTPSKVQNDTPKQLSSIDENGEVQEIYIPSNLTHDEEPSNYHDNVKAAKEKKRNRAFEKMQQEHMNELEKLMAKDGTPRLLKHSNTRKELNKMHTVETFLTSHKNCLNLCRYPFVHTVYHKWFKLVTTIAALLSLIVLAVDQYGISSETSDALMIINIVFIVFFVMEALIKIVGYGPKHYFTDVFFVFEFLLAFGVLLQYLIAGEVYLGAFRSFRVFELAVLFRDWDNFLALFNAVLLSSIDLFYFSIILLLFIFIYAVLGFQQFSGMFIAADGTSERANFDTFGMSLITVFQIMTGENWNEVLYIGHRNIGIGADIYFITLFCFGNYIMLSTLLAIMLGNFDKREKLDELLMNEEKSEEIPDKAGVSCTKLIGQYMHNLWLKMDRHPNESQAITDYQAPIHARVSGLHRPLSKRFSNKDHPLLKVSLTVKQSRHSVQQRKKEDVFLFGRSLGIFTADNAFRDGLARISLSDKFEYFILVLILISSLLLALETPDLPETNPEMFFVISCIEYVIFALFVVEMCMKIIARQFWFGKGAYLTSGWNIVDFMVILFSILTYVPSLSQFKALRAIRAARPLRLVSRFESMKIVVESIVATVPALMNVLIITVVIFSCFGLLGMAVFKGRLRRCFAPMFLPKVDEVDCPGEWRNGKIGFDTFSETMLVLVEACSLEMWPDLMYELIDSTPPGLAPERDHSLVYSLYFIAFIIAGSFFVVGLFVGVVVDEYKAMHAKLTGAAALSTAQRQYLLAYKEMIYSSPEAELNPPVQTCCKCEQGVRYIVFKVVTHRFFDLAVMMLICVNTILMTVSYYGQAKDEVSIMELINNIFTFVFTAECILKIFALGIRQYLSRGWNRFDAFIVITSLLAYGLERNSLAMTLDPTAFRVVRVLRLFRLVKQAKGLRQLIRTLVFSLPALWNVGVLLILLLFVYAVIGMFTLGHVRMNGFLNEHANFQTFGTAFLTLFRMCTGESWNGLMHSCAIQPPNCDKEVDCAEPIIVYSYFISFFFLSSLLMLNVFVAVILKNFEEEVTKDPVLNTTPVKRMMIAQFGVLWSKLADRGDVNLMDINQLSVFLNLLPEPLGLGRSLPGGKMILYLDGLDLPQFHGRVHYLDVCLALTQRVFEAIDPESVKQIPDDNPLLKAIRANVYRSFPELKKTKKYNFGAGQLLAVKKMQKAWRKSLANVRAKAGAVEPLDSSRIKDDIPAGGNKKRLDNQPTTTKRQTSPPGYMSDSDDIFIDSSVGPEHELLDIQDNMERKLLVDFLNSVGMGEYSRSFIEQKLKLADLPHLTKDDLTAVIPLLGPRLQFAEVLKKESKRLKQAIAAAKKARK